MTEVKSSNKNLVHEFNFEFTDTLVFAIATKTYLC